MFSAGIGEHAAPVRAGILEGLDFLGVEIDAAANHRHAECISTPRSRVAVRVIPTDEEAMVARHMRTLLA